MKRNACGSLPRAAIASPLKRLCSLPMLPSHSSFASPMNVRTQLGVDMAASLPVIESFDVAGVASYIQKHGAHNIIVMTGAGVSVSAGIPDFRSPGTGLYHNLQKYNLPTPESVFSLDYFRSNPRPFCMLAKELYPGNFAPTPAHHFVKLLHDEGRLLRNYTQNIDGLERLAGVPPEKLVEAHGTFSSAHCLSCGRRHNAESVRTVLFNNDVPRCGDVAALTPTNDEQSASSKFRNQSDLLSPINSTSLSFNASPSPALFSDSGSITDGFENDFWNTLSEDSASSVTASAPVPPPCQGLVKPDIVFFGESLDHRFFALAAMDFPRCDMLIIMGTSLEVQPFAGLINRVPSRVPRLLINLNPVGMAQSIRLVSVERSFFAIEPTTSTSDSERPSSNASSSSESSERVAVEESNSLKVDSSPDCDGLSEATTEEEEEEESECPDAPHIQINRHSKGFDVFVEKGAENDSQTLSIIESLESSVGSNGLRFHLPDNTRDVFLQGTCDGGVIEFARQLGWEDRLRTAMESSSKST